MAAAASTKGVFRPGDAVPSAYSRAVRLELELRDLVLASWPVPPETVAQAVYPGLEPAEVDGRTLISLAAVRFAGGRLGRLRVPPFSQLNVRTYVRFEGRQAVFFVRSYVTLGGIGGALLGAPFRAARIRVAPGFVEVPGAGVRIGFAPGEPVEPGVLGRHEVGLFEAAGLRAFRIEREPAAWRRAELAGEPRTDVLLALGFDVARPDSVLYATGGSLAFGLPPRLVSGASSSPRRSRR
jgi:hypothetical protein